MIGQIWCVHDEIGPKFRTDFIVDTKLKGLDDPKCLKYLDVNNMKIAEIV